MKSQTAKAGVEKKRFDLAEDPMAKVLKTNNCCRVHFITHI
jgi:hypothetical protein